MVAALPHRHVYMAAGKIVLDRIVDKIHSHFPQQSLIAQYRRLLQRAVNGHFLFYQHRFHKFDDILYNFRQAHRFAMNLFPIFLDAGQVHDFFNHSQQPLRLLADKRAEMDDVGVAFK